MIPKDKAEDLIKKMDVKHYLKFANLKEGCKGLPVSMYNDQMKQCALICVDEILFALNTTECNTTLSGIIRNDYWQEVKKEIENL